MKILIEGEGYHIKILRNIFDDPKFYTQNGEIGVITSVGYYHSHIKNELVYMLPKVYMRDNNKTIFDISKDELIDIEQNETFKHKAEYNWIRQMSIYFYNSLTEFRRRNPKSNIVQSSLSYNLNSNIGTKEYSYLDLVLAFVNFHKKNKRYILYRHVDYISKQAKKPNWNKTIRKSIPLLTNDNKPFYTIYRNKKKVVNNEEELLVYFFSILNNFNEEHNLYINIDKSYELIKGNKFKSLQKTGLSKLKKIKHRYFNDTLKRMYHLCELYFSQTDTASLAKKKEDFLCVNNYNLVFEDMIDKLFSDKLIKKETNDGVSLKKLKYNDDGKIIDHIYEHNSLLDTTNIFYIGDSKYYKSDSSAGKVSKYKQFTYAKNVIQYNIDLLNDKKEYNGNIRYRDDLTEGYDITPNFFIYGYIDDKTDFENDRIEQKGEIVKSFHFKNRLFDRDTLFVHQYKINFLYILKNYSQFNNVKVEKFRTKTKKLFRDKFINYFNDSSACNYVFYSSEINTNVRILVDTNFKLLNGKCFSLKDNRLIVAVNTNDVDFDRFREKKLNNFTKFSFT
ncbi:MAG: hypothetical protein N4A72_05900 [Bacteroidales bacterium]|jgi:hypothetical protein|nr:hypothetical protein [Bacteroidales bacterium]